MLLISLSIICLSILQSVGEKNTSIHITEATQTRDNPHLKSFNILHFCLLFNINVKVRLSQLSWILASDDEFGCKMMVHFSMVSRTSCFCWLSIWQFLDPRYLIFFYMTAFSNLWTHYSQDGKTSQISTFIARKKYKFTQSLVMPSKIKLINFWCHKKFLSFKNKTDCFHWLKNDTAV